MEVLFKWNKAKDNFNNLTYTDYEPLSFGNTFLDKATRGIFPDDLILLGAPTGVGKTQFCTNVALANVQKGRRVHFIALEASEDEIQKRIAYNLFANLYFNDTKRITYPRVLNFPDFMLGKFNLVLDPYTKQVEQMLESYEGLNIHYGGHEFTSDDLITRIMGIHEETDLIIVDHVHYFDYEAKTTENEALKKIAKTARRISQLIKKPIILVAHLRKKDKMSKELVPGIEEFHGSSDLTKIATKVITLAIGNMVGPGIVENYMRVVKNRFDGSVKGYTALMHYNFKRGCYDPKCCIGRLDKGGSVFVEVKDEQDKPYWAR